MIKIHPKLWYVLTQSKHKEDKLAYMTHYGTDEAFKKRMDTGTSWAGVPYSDRNESLGAIVENVPTKGFYIGSSVCRWSTSNKLFRVEDPRGFIVEVPTDNIATLLHHCTVINGVVQEECLWGREGNNHILLPINSQPYLETLDKMDVLENKLISIKDLKKGDVVKLFEDKNEYTYLGKIKFTWKITPYRWIYNREQVFHEPVIVEDDKYVDVFRIYYGNKPYYETFSKPKIVEIVRNEEVNMKGVSMYVPQRALNKANVNTSYFNSEVVSWKEKE